MLSRINLNTTAASLHISHQGIFMSEKGSTELFGVLNLPSGHGIACTGHELQRRLIQGRGLRTGEAAGSCSKTDSASPTTKKHSSAASTFEIRYSTKKSQNSPL